MRPVLRTSLKEADDLCLLFDRVQMYSDETGVPIKQCMKAAFEMWLECEAEPNLIAFRRKMKHTELRIVKS